MRKNERHKRPSKAYKESLRQMTVADYTQLEKACLQSLILSQEHVILAVSHLTKLPDDFPKGVLFKKVGLVDYRRIIAVKLLGWLNAKGYSTITTEHIRVAKERLTKSLKEIQAK